MARLRDLPVEWASAGRPRPGQAASGDAALVAPYAGGVLLAVVDGVGHGEEAARAAAAARELLERHAGEPLEELVQRCHQALLPTRGAVMSLAALDAGGAMRWLGVGNVVGSLLRARGASAEELLLRAGVVGGRLPLLQGAGLGLGPGDRLVLATDGVSPAFPRDLARTGTVRSAAERILQGHASPRDDALVLVAGWLGEARP